MRQRSILSGVAMVALVWIVGESALAAQSSFDVLKAVYPFGRSARVHPGTSSFGPPRISSLVEVASPFPSVYLVRPGDFGLDIVDPIFGGTPVKAFEPIPATGGVVRYAVTTTFPGSFPVVSTGVEIRAYSNPMPVATILATDPSFGAALYAGANLVHSLTPAIDPNDVVVGSPGESVGGMAGAGVARAYDGATGALLWNPPIMGHAPHVALGTAITKISDVDFDGVEDIVISEPIEIGFTGGACLRGYSGATGFTTLFNILDPLGNPVSVSGAFGARLATVGDLNGDGFVEYVASHVDAAFVYCGISGSLIRAIHAPNGAVSGMVSHVGSLGDQNGDGRREVVVWFPGNNSFQGFAGPLEVHSIVVNGAVTTSQLLSSTILPFPSSANDPLIRLEGAGDHDGDGLEDLLFGSLLLGHPSLPGNTDDFILRVASNATAPLNEYPERFQSLAGDFITLQADSPNGSFWFQPPVVVAQFFTTGSMYPHPASLPSYVYFNHIVTPAPFIAFDGTALNGLGQSLLSPSGYFLTFVAPLGLSGFSVMTQAILPTVAPAGSLFVTSPGRVIEFL